MGGNWKMHDGLTQLSDLSRGIRQALSDFSAAEIALFPSFVYLPTVQTLLEGGLIALGGQNLCQQPTGAYTGEISAAMLQEFGCRYVIIGHSERRELYHESDELVAEKFVMAQQQGLCPLLCVGETLAQREAGNTAAVVCRQLNAVLQKAGVASFANALLAYEPVWAIGSGRAATSEQAQQAHQILRAHIAEHDTAVAEQLRIIYGGSLKPATAADIFAQTDVDGGLIGGASLQVESFVAICRAVVHNGGR
ncbi:MAG: triose-phosphate isomerase [Gammaproteobacteria bacterium]|nr:triose-phosphate isomerase [Gammaproteobacteria bacterium]